MANNLPLSPVVVPVNPNIEGVNSGMAGGTCQSVVGENTGAPNPKASDWSRDARLLQKGAPIGWGGDNVVSGQETADIQPLNVVDYAAGDFNDNASFVMATGAVAPDAVIADGAVNRTGVALVANDWAWGTVPVA
jgi:hypothetical protein